MPAADSDKFARIDVLAEEFADRYRRGERPSVTEYAHRHPDLADDLRELIPAMVEIEVAKERESPPPETMGDYELLREIGRGGMGVVYEAQQISLGRRVALKLLPQGSHRDANAKRRFEREARAAGRLHHTNIVPVFGTGEHRGAPYYVMQYIPGQGLDKVIDELKGIAGAGHMAEPEPTRPLRNQAGPITQSLLTSDSPLPRPVQRRMKPSDSAAGTASTSANLLRQTDSIGRQKPANPYWKSVANIGAQVASALDYAHNQGVVHRDIKPSNLLLDLMGTVWITDFGLAKSQDQEAITDSGDILGTIRYMPPEAFEGKQDRLGDIYSLGLSLYELLALKPAFHDEDRNRLIFKVSGGQPERLDVANPEVPDDLVTIVHKAMDRERAGRYASGAELAADLRRFLDDEPIKARRLGSLERLARWRRHNPALAGVVTALAGILLMVTIISLAAATRFNRMAANEGNIRQQAESNFDEAKRQRDRAEDSLYNSRIAQAHVQYRLGNVGKARQCLAECVPAAGSTDRRGWEWRFLNGLLNQELHTFGPHECWMLDRPDEPRVAWINSLAFSADGRWLAVGSRPPNFLWATPAMPADLKVWNLATGAEDFSFGGPQAGIHACGALAFKAGDRALYVNTYDTKAPTPPAFLEINLAGDKPKITHADCGKAQAGYLIGKGGDHIVVRDIETGAETRLDSGPVLEAHIAATDRSTLLSIDVRGEARLWNLKTREARSIGRFPIPEHGSVAFSPDGTLLLIRPANNEYAEIHSIPKGGKIHTIRDGATFQIHALCFSPDGKRLAYGGYGCRVHVMDLASLREEFFFRGHDHPVSSIVFSPDGRRLASGDWSGKVKVWDMTRPAEHLVAGDSIWCADFAFARRDGRNVVARATVNSPQHPPGTHIEECGLNGEKPRRVLELAANPLIRRASRQDAQFSADGGMVALVGVAPGTIDLIDARDGRKLRTLPGLDRAATELALSPDGGTAAMFFQDSPGETILNVRESKEDGRSRSLSLGQSRVAWPKFSPDGSLLAWTGSEPAGAGRRFVVKTWGWRDGEPIEVAGSDDAFDGIAFSGDGRFLAVATPTALTLWNLAERKPVWTVRKQVFTFALAFNPDGTRLAGSNRSDVTIWNTRTGEETLALAIPGSASGASYSPKVAFSPDGELLGALHSNGTVIVWSAGERGK